MPPEGASQTPDAGGTPVGTTRVTFEATIERIIEHAPDTRSLLLRLPAHHHFTFLPGQFISCLLPVGGETIIRPYSIASNPENNELLEICLNLVPDGVGSHYLFELAVGAVVRFTGPWGIFTLDRPPQAECIFIAHGTGIAPIRPMIRRVLSSSVRYAVHLHHAAATARHLLYRDEFEAAARAHPEFTFSPSGDNSLAAVIEQTYVARDRDRSRHFYICGIGAIVPQLRDLLRRAGYERRAVQYEKW